MSELSAKVRAVARRLRSWSQRDLLGLAGASASGWIAPVAGRQVAIVWAADKVAKGRIAFLVLAMEPRASLPAAIEFDGFVASPRKWEEIVNRPRIMVRLQRRASSYAVELLESRPPNQGLETDG